MNKFTKDLEKKLMGEKITLPESLSAENIENMLNEKGKNIEPKRKRIIQPKAVVRWCSAAAAVLIATVGVLAVLGGGNIGIEMQDNNNQPNQEEQQQIIKDITDDSSDYSAIETTILNYFSTVFTQSYVKEDADGFNIGNIFNGASSDTASSGSASSSSSISSSTAEGSENSNVSSSYTDTNTQVDGVDEADVVKTDGEYIYYLRNQYHEVVITDCKDSANPFIKSRIKLSNRDEQLSSEEMFLYNNTLIVVLRKHLDYDIRGALTSSATADCTCYALRSDTVVRMFDITDKENPEEIHSLTLSGDYISSRITNNRLILVTRFNIPYSSVNATDFDVACRAMQEICIPEYSINGSEMQRIPADRIDITSDKTPSSYAIISVTDLLSETKETKMNAFLGNVNEIYCTSDELFISETHYSTWMQDNQTVVADSLGTEFNTVTKIMRMAITDDGAQYIADVTVGGICINQFSMDKYGEYFRIATIGCKYDKPENESMVYIIDKNMQIKGYLDGIAKNEDMKAARFMGNTLYLVTFMQTDPLFVIDLSDVENPVIKGELQIPGFSTYLHPVGDGLMLGLGAGGSMNGVDGTAKISLFDVSDPCNPRELDNFTTNSYASFAGGHKGFVTVDENSFAASVVYGVSTGAVYYFSIENRSIIMHEIYTGMTGSNFNENTRGVFIGHNLFVVNNAGIISYDTRESIALWQARLSFF